MCGVGRTTSIYTIITFLSRDKKRHAAGEEGDVESPGGMARTFLRDTGEHLVEFRVVGPAHAALKKDVLDGGERFLRLPCDAAHDEGALVSSGLLNAVLVCSLDGVVIL